MEKAVFFDRDGVINKAIVKDGKPYPPSDITQFEWNEKIEEVLDYVKSLGYLAFIFTNQPDVARGAQTKENVESIHKLILSKLSIDEIYCCYHDSGDNCECRKPKPGMLYEAQNKYNIDLGKSFVIGDRWRDIEAGKQAGCKTIFIDYHYDESLKSRPDYVIDRIQEVLYVI
ncbi:MAG: HAD family hydrolase [Leptospiraceae bacterium]|nr:HAD family hydrolase [Leptospiraceae bacterium]MCP5495102.1 HAD family hydrolase [Leptospiraceae bacterium]